MKFLFVTDLHGQISLYAQLADYCRREAPDIMLWGGDMLPDGRRPDFHREALRFIDDFLQNWWELLKADLPHLQVYCVLGNHDWLASARRLFEVSSGSGHYVGVAALSKLRAPFAEPDAGHPILGTLPAAQNPLSSNSHRQGATPADGLGVSPQETLASQVPDLRPAALDGPTKPQPTWLTSGPGAMANHPHGPIAKRLSHWHPVSLPGVDLYGYSHVPMTPWIAKDVERVDMPGDVEAAGGYPGRRAAISRGETVVELPSGPAEHFAGKPTIYEELAALPQRPMHQAIWVSHAPPAGTHADLMYGQIHMGSRGIRAYIERAQPSVSLHGHIHEAPMLSGAYANWLGSTLVINPGRTRKQLDAVTFVWPDVAGSLRHSRLGRWQST